jgi:hypothetical protein
MAAARSLGGGGFRFAVAIFAAVLATSPAAPATLPDWLRNVIRPVLPKGRLSELVTARYASDDGVLFILDRSGGRPLLRFEGRSEVWALYASRGPGGDIFYTDDIGEHFLRVTRLGGMTLYTSDRPQGSAVVSLGPCPPLRLTPLGVIRFTQHIIQSSARASRAVQHTVYFYGPGSEPNSKAPTADLSNDALIADAAAVAADAIIVLAARTGGRGVSVGVTAVALDIGSHPDVTYRAGVVRVLLAPSQGYAGRPSSHRILRALASKGVPAARALQKPRPPSRGGS